MNTQELKNETRTKLEEIDFKIKTLKERARSNNTIDHNLQKLINDLEERRNHVLFLYNQIDELEKDERLKLTELDKNIYNGIDSFNRAFTNAGSIFKTH